MTKQNKMDMWVKICLLPLIIGGSLIIANISLKLFKILGWMLVSIGLVTGAFYLYELYKKHREKILKFLRKIYLIKGKNGKKE